MAHAATGTAFSPRIESRLGAGVLARPLLWFQGVYYLLTGVWPILSVRSFQYVTGYKTDNLPTGREPDHWLVMTVSVLVTAVAISILTAAWRNRPSLETAVLAIGAAVGLTAIDVIYVSRQVIPPVYLLDACLEVPLIVAWCAFFAMGGHSTCSNTAEARR